jgi:cytochrome c oxidase subunit 4
MAHHEPAHATGHGHDTPVAPGVYQEHAHPTESVYVRIGIILAVITAIEVAIYYIEWVRDNNLLVPALILFSAIKFVMVVGYFMHLKFDDRRFTWIFAFGLAVALATFLATAALFAYHSWDVV